MLLRIVFILTLGLAILGSVSSTWAQAKFTAYISPGTIGKDETAELKLLVENAATVQK
ncbi:MAG: hypothetical protein RL172_2577, partial [Bacteroidota bacterium]